MTTIVHAAIVAARQSTSMACAGVAMRMPKRTNARIAWISSMTSGGMENEYGMGERQREPSMF